MLCAGLAHGQTATDEDLRPDQAIEAYLDKLGLKRVLIEQLEQRLGETAREQKPPIAERLGRLYVDMLGTANNPQDRAMWEDRAKTLLTQVPEADSFELRLSLHKAVYLRAEDIAERHRLRLASADEVADAERSFKSLTTQFTEIASKVHRRVDTLEKVEQTGDATERVIEELADARRLRSLSFYYAGWSNVYLSMLTKTEPPANDALRNFGWLLNAGSGRQATVDRVQPAMFQYEHVARSALGAALAASQRGSDTEALRWLDALGDSQQTPQNVRDQLASRRLIVLGSAKRWYDVELLVRRTRRPERPATPNEVRPLPTAMARLLAVITLEADRAVASEQIERLAKIALADLVANKEVGQVLDLVNKYGTAPLGESGFIVSYVRALQAYDAARKAHETAAAAKGVPNDDPTEDATAINQYRTAAGMFGAAIAESDSEEFKSERARAAIMQGRSLYFSGVFVEAADKFNAAWELAGKGEQGEEAIWLSVLALEKAAKGGGKPIQDRLNQTIALYLQHYPDSERAPRLVLMQAASGQLADDDALKVLSGVAKDSPVYDASRRQVARILYSKFRAARGAERDFAAMRFVAVGEEVLGMDRKAAMDGKASESLAAADRAVVRARQLLDALLSVTAPDASRAESVLQVLRGVATMNNIDLRNLESELLFRELQIALLRGNDPAAEEVARKLLASKDATGQFAAAGERLMYRRAANRWRPGMTAAEGVDPDALTQQVVKYGRMVIDRLGQSRDVFRDNAVIVLYSTVADAAMERWRTAGDTAMRDLAILLDGTLLQVQPRLEPALRRLAESSEAAGSDNDVKTALGCWLTLLSASQQGTDAWYEARYNSIRLLFKADAVKARDAMAQHRLLYPEYGPEPWGQKLRALDAEMGAGMPGSTPPTPGPAAVPASLPGGGQ